MTQNKIIHPERIITDSFDLLPLRYYQMIVADPAWKYDNKVTGGSGKSGACQKYDVMTTEDIANLPIKSIAAKDAVLYLWITTPMKADIFKSDIISKWGFEYKTTIYWHKTIRVGLGFYHRGDVEECLVCVRGKIPAWREQTSNFFEEFAPLLEARPTGHSVKPQKFWDEYVFPVAAKLKFDRNVELFSRSPQPNWDAFGNECEVPA